MQQYDERMWSAAVRRLDAGPSRMGKALASMAVSSRAVFEGTLAGGKGPVTEQAVGIVSPS